MTSITTGKSTALQHRTFGRTGLKISPVGFGGAPIGLLETERQRVGEILNLLLDRGVNLIDTAAMYLGSEAAIGATVGHRRDEFVLVSKCGMEDQEIDAPAWSPKLIRAQIERSLERLKTDRIDVMLLHSCDLDVLRKGEALQALTEAQRQGKIRFAGYSGDNEAAAYAAGLPDVAVIQTSVSICDQANISHVLPLTRKHNVGVMAKRPLANAAWKTLDDQYERYRNYARPYHERFAAMGLTAASVGFDESKHSWAEVALRFTLGVLGVHVAIVGTTDPGHIEPNLEAAANGPLPDQIYRTLRNAWKTTDPQGEWKGLT